MFKLTTAQTVFNRNKNGEMMRYRHSQPQFNNLGLFKNNQESQSV